MACVPADSEVAMKVATPVPLSVPLPIMVEPSKKSTVPAGGPMPDETVAVKPTLWPNEIGLRLDPSAVVVMTGLTTWDVGAEVLAAKLALPW